MSVFRPLIIIAIVANALSIFLYNNAASQPGGTGALLAFIVLWMPAIWLTTMVLTLILAVKQRKTLFAAGTIKWAILILLFCTPIPIYLGYQLTHPTPETVRSSSSYDPRDGKVYKTESWYYSADPRQKYLDMYFVADSIDERRTGENAFKKDSVWIYFTKTGDTLKVEKYKAGQLISVDQYAKE